MKSPRLWLLTGLALTLGACSTAVNPDDAASSSSAMTSSPTVSSDDGVRETHGVSYQGTVQKAGMSIYMQGTHRLELSDGRFVLLESDDLDLDIYVGKKVAVLGSARPTVEGDGTILRVEQITLLQDAEESSSSSSETSSSESSSSSSDSSSSSSSSSMRAASSVPASSRAAVSSVAAVISSSSSSSSSSSAITTSDTGSDDLTARAAIMAKASMAENLWTQQYCSTHIGFCFPVHKNWWFKSFGTTTSYLWHVEIGTEDITELGQGPLVVNLMAGSLASTGNADGSVKAQGDFVVGFKAFSDTSHFEVSAPKILQEAVTYLVNHIQAQ